VCTGCTPKKSDAIAAQDPDNPATDMAVCPTSKEATQCKNTFAMKKPEDSKPCNK